MGTKNIRKRWVLVGVLDILPVEFHYTRALVHTHIPPRNDSGESTSSLGEGSLL